MSKLFGKMASDTKKQTTSTGNRVMSFEGFSGSASDSMRIVAVDVMQSGRVVQITLFDTFSGGQHQIFWEPDTGRLDIEEDS